MKFPVFDLHCDTALELMREGFDISASLRRNDLHIDLERAQTLPGYVQCFACFTTDSKTLPLPVPPETVFQREKDTILNQLQQNGDLIRQAFSVSDIQQNQQLGLMSGVLTIEGPAGFGFDPAALQSLYEMGYRITTLGWNEDNPLAGSHKTKGGLKPKGIEYVKEAQRLGMIVDVSHISDAAFWDIIQITTAPIIASHSNSRAVWDDSRNLTDEMFMAICKTGGIVGINLYSCFLGEDPDLDTVCDHILHFLSLDPDGHHVGLGGDLDGCESLPKGFTGIQDYAKLAEFLLKRGVCEATIMDIFWNNAVRVMKRCWK